MVEVEGLNEVMQNLKDINKKALPTAAKKGALEVAREIVRDYKKNVPRKTGLLRQSARAVPSYTTEQGVYRAAAVVFRTKKVSRKIYENLKKAKKWTHTKYNDKKQKTDYFSSAYYAHYIEYGFEHQGREPNSIFRSAKTTSVKGAYTMKKARKKVESNTEHIVETKLNAELDKLGF